MSQSMSLAPSGYTIFSTCAWCLIAGFVGLILVAVTIKASGENRTTFVGVTLPTSRELHRLAVGWCGGMIFGFAWGGWELNAVDSIDCEPLGLRVASNLTNQLIFSKDDLYINVVRVDFRGSNQFRVEFNINENNKLKTVKLPFKNAELAKIYAIQCLRRVHD